MRRSQGLASRPTPCVHGAPRMAIGGRVATSAAAMLAVLFVAIDLHGTWVQMPTHYASTTDATLVWSRLTVIHPAVLSGDRRWLFLATYLGALCLVVGGLVYAWR